MWFLMLNPRCFMRIVVQACTLPLASFLGLSVVVTVLRAIGPLRFLLFCSLVDRRVLAFMYASLFSTTTL